MQVHCESEGASVISRVIFLCVLLSAATFALCPNTGTAGGGAADEAPMVIGVPQPPEMKRMAEQRDYLQGWSHGTIYVEKNVIPTPARERRLLDLPAGAWFTALADRPCGPSVVVGITSATASSLTEVRVSPEQGPGRVLFESSALGEDLWFGEPTSHSPNGRWLLVTVRPGRRELFGAGPPKAEKAVAARQAPGALYLVDCAQQRPPSLLQPDCLLAAAAWTLSGDKVACTLRLEDGWAVALLTPASAEQRVVLRRPAQAAWAVDGSRLRLFVGDCVQVSEVVYHPESGELEAFGSSRARAAAQMDAAWSEDRSILAWTEPFGDRDSIELSTADKELRLASVAAGVDRLLGWSCGGQLLAYRDLSGGLQLTSGTRSQEVLQSIKTARSAFPRSKRHPAKEGGLTLGTTFTPVRIGEDDLAGWARTSEGPCLLYTANGSQDAPRLSAIYFWERTLLELGVDLSKDLVEEDIKFLCESHLQAVEFAIRQYARDHGGLYPPHASGPELVKDLEKYGEMEHFMGSALAPDEYRVRLLYPGGTREDVLREAAELGQTHLPLLELQETDGRIFHIYTDEWVWMTLPNGVPQRINMLGRE